MKLFIQLFITLIFVQIIKSKYTELSYDVDLQFIGYSRVYLDLTKKGELEIVYLKIIQNLPKGFDKSTKSLNLQYLESNMISDDLFDNLDNFNNIESYPYDSSDTPWKEYKYKYEIQLKRNAKYLLFILPIIIGPDFNIIEPDYFVGLIDYKIKSNSTFTIIFIIIFIVIIVIIAIFVYIHYKKKKISENNNSFNIDKNQILSSEKTGVQNSNIGLTPCYDGQNPNYEVQNSNNGMTPIYDNQKPDYSVQNNNNGITQNYDTQKNDNDLGAAIPVM